MAIANEVRQAQLDAVTEINEKGVTVALEAYKTLKKYGRTAEEVAERTKVLMQLNLLGRAWYVLASIQSFVNQAELKWNTISTAFGGVRTIFAVPAQGTHYLVAVDVMIDVNGGVVVTQWVTVQPVLAKNIPALLSGKASTLKESKLSGDYFEKYSEINAVTGSIVRTVESMERAVTQRLTEKLKQMRGMVKGR